MDLRSIFGKQLHNGAFDSNATAVNMSDSIPNGLEGIITLLGSRNPLVQLFMVLHQMIGSRIGVDSTMLLTLFGFVWAANKLLRQVFMAVYRFIDEYMTASISVSSGDEIYLHLMKWLASQPMMVNSRSLTAETLSKTAWEEEEADVLATKISPDGQGVYLNFSNQEAKMPPRFIPALGVHGFWYAGSYFRLHRKQESFLEDSGSNGQTFKDKENLTISCFGRSPEPIKRLFQHAKQAYYNEHHAKTIVKRPSTQSMRRFGGRHAWAQVANRPVRPMKTVVLDSKQKVQVLADINEYLHPATPQWYANRGIPLRRGYLFHGPPGTGKTSLSFALAGVFGLDIYVISLLEPTLTEEDLLALFNTLPRRCVVLLEDIDTAGLARPEDDQYLEATTNGDAGDTAEEKKEGGDRGEGRRGGRSAGGGAARTGAGEGGPKDWKVSDLARELKKQVSDEKKGISLSGLLNAIDGVASHEGRVLIMTTNKPDALDDALIRPGRVDLQVGFTNATREQARELFVRMYEADSRHRTPRPVPRPSADDKAGVGVHLPGEEANGQARDGRGETNGHAKEFGRPQSGGGEDWGALSRDALNDHRLDIELDELEGVASEFASKIPEGHFSPAELQGFLLKRKKDPRRALAEVDIWVDAMIKQKASKTKVLQVQ